MNLWARRKRKQKREKNSGIREKNSKEEDKDSIAREYRQPTMYKRWKANMAKADIKGIKGCIKGFWRHFNINILSNNIWENRGCIEFKITDVLKILLFICYTKNIL